MTLLERTKKLEIAVFGKAHEDSPPPVAPPPVTGVSVPSEAYTFSAAGLLAGGRSIGEAYVEPVVGPDCPHTVTLPVTGHTLSIPRPDLGEMMIGYMMRVFDQAKGEPHMWDSLGSVMLFGSSSFWPGFDNANINTWPEAVDRWYNARAYMTPSERVAADNAAAQWIAVQKPK